MNFYIDDDSMKKLLEWELNEHKDKCTIINSGAIGGKFTYSFTPNSLGIVIKVKCACGMEVDITDYDW